MQNIISIICCLVLEEGKLQRTEEVQHIECEFHKVNEEVGKLRYFPFQELGRHPIMVIRKIMVLEIQIQVRYKYRWTNSDKMH